MFKQLTPTERVHLSKCIYEESDLKSAATRIAIENPNLPDSSTGQIGLLRAYTKTSEHWANVKMIRKDLDQYVEDHPYIPPLDRLKALVHQLDDGKERLGKVPQKDFLNWTRMSAEIRQILQCLREEARSLSLGAALEDGDIETNPVLRELRKMNSNKNLEAQLQELGVLPTN